MPNAIELEVLKDNISAYIELFEMDCTAISGIGIVYYLTTNKTAVSFGNTTYNPFPMTIEGVQSTADGAPSRPTIQMSNIANNTGTLMKFIGSLAFLHEDLIGVKVTYIRTFSIYLNSATRISAPPLKYTIAKKLEHNKGSLKFELRNPLDKERAYLPKRQMLKRDFPGLGINKRVG
ncbi:gp18 Phage-related protein [uncultured Caudovirales phage]|uniref:Gp18 Phage-related protein n=1 Tax=uncultured Caudovirales phage TaxID=2100421 RepID=A0A6J7X7R7_9CAUD|nr:gp18 Phage-related protein [uncultured Caudovirales phage]CAB5226961.1 gp18 Phage-related protein [uncultured Caudovirales phage]